MFIYFNVIPNTNKIENEFKKYSIKQIFIGFFFIIRTIIIALFELLINQNEFQEKEEIFINLKFR